MKTIRLVLADDQVLFVESLRIVIETRSSRDMKMNVVATANDGIQAVEAVRRTDPDVVLMDVRMPNLDGVEATRIIHQEFPSINIIMLTTFADDDYVYEALRCGASGYILKDMPPADLIETIHAVRAGGVMISPAVADKLVSKMHQSGTLNAEPDSMQDKRAPFFSLSKREQEIYKLIFDGYDNKEIAEKLYIAEQTVKNHISEIYSKFGVHDRLHLMRPVQSGSKK
ncbi:MAG: response regulator transcription factor [Sedimentisphaerales bacterium]|nr:response regulator transcription factor [Sedimentisphaerales bacterium]